MIQKDQLRLKLVTVRCDEETWRAFKDYCHHERMSMNSVLARFMAERGHECNLQKEQAKKVLKQINEGVIPLSLNDE